MAEMTRRSFFGVAAAAGAMAAMPAIASADEAAEGITVGMPVDAPPIPRMPTSLSSARASAASLLP